MFHGCHLQLVTSLINKFRAKKNTDTSGKQKCKRVTKSATMSRFRKFSVDIPIATPIAVTSSY